MAKKGRRNRFTNQYRKELVRKNHPSEQTEPDPKLSVPEDEMDEEIRQFEELYYAKREPEPESRWPI